MRPAAVARAVRRADRLRHTARCTFPSVNAQEHSREALLESLREVLHEALEYNRQDALEAAGLGAEELGLLLFSEDICFTTSAAIAVNS